MILIVSNSNDKSTGDVINWLNHLGKKHIRINIQDNVSIEFISNDIILKVNNLLIKLSDITSFWYRRGFINVKNDYATNVSQFDNLLTKEFNNIIQFLYYELSKVKHINLIENSEVNKLIVSDKARNLDIKTPDDFIISNLEDLKLIMSETDKKYITKVSSGYCMQYFDDFTIFNYANLIDIEESIPESFFPSLVQNYIPKKIELRIFYLDGEFFTMAIFSQKDNKTNIDFRNYNDDKPNRTVPYKVTKEVEQKLDLLMKALGLNCGSIDMIVTPNNEYVFLEVNPVGQFGMVSHPCNYNIEKRIAEYL